MPKLSKCSETAALKPSALTARNVLHTVSATSIWISSIFDNIFIVRGKLRKKVWINQGDIILLSLRDYQDEKGDVLLKYSADEARSLKAYGELPESAKINETDTYGHEGDEGIGFEFDEDRDSSDDKEIDVDEI